MAGSEVTCPDAGVCEVPGVDGLAGWRTALAVDPFDAVALHGMGCALLQQNRPAQAVALLSAAAHSRADAAVLSDLGSALIACGQHDEAEQRLREAVAVDPVSFHALFNLGGLLLSGDAGEALVLLRRAVDVAQTDGDAVLAVVSALVTQGNAAYGAGDMAAAERLYREAIAFKPDFAGSHVNLGNALIGQLRTGEALAAYRCALDMAPESDSVAFAYSLCLLLVGDRWQAGGGGLATGGLAAGGLAADGWEADGWEAGGWEAGGWEAGGWRHYERRRGVPTLLSNYVRRPDLAQWRIGTELAGRRVLLMAEQGAGDLIQYARLAPALARIASRVVLEIPWPMAGILDDLPGVAAVITMGDAAADCDFACPLLSLPLLLGEDAGVAPPYISLQPDRVARWAAWLDRSPFRRRIGLVCSGDPRHPHDSRRSVPLADFAPVLAVADVSFVLIQTEICESDLAAFDAAENVRCPAAALTDYADTAGLLSGLDLVISVDTSVAHLAGAMGKRVWTLLPYCPDYRWKLGRGDTAWYPSMRLFRQDRPGAWDTVIGEVADALVRLG